MARPSVDTFKIHNPDGSLKISGDPEVLKTLVAVGFLSTAFETALEKAKNTLDQKGQPTFMTQIQAAILNTAPRHTAQVNVDGAETKLLLTRRF
jgi:hypothetical protein